MDGAHIWQHGGTLRRAEVTKQYDKSYFDRWYRHPRHRIGTARDLERQVDFAVALTELVQGEPLRSVLDIGAGEGRWQPILARLRPRARYAGVEPSQWAVHRWGKRRNLRLGSLDTLDELGLDAPFDLVICADVLHYLSTPALGRGLLQLAPQVGTLAYCPTFTSEDVITGDRRGFHRRRASTYRRRFEAAGLRQVGPWAWCPEGVVADMAALA